MILGLFECMYDVEIIKALFVILLQLLSEKSHLVNESIPCTFFLA